MKITTIPVDNDPTFSERSEDGIYLIRSIERKFMLKMFSYYGKVLYWTQYSTLDEESKESEEEEEENDVGAIVDLAGDHNENSENIGAENNDNNYDDDNNNDSFVFSAASHGGNNRRRILQ